MENWNLGGEQFSVHLLYLTKFYVSIIFLTNTL